MKTELAETQRFTFRSNLFQLLRMGHQVRIEVGIAVGIVGALVGVDGGVDRHAGPEQVLPRDA